MKTTAYILLAGLVLSAASALQAGPPSQYFETLRREQQFRALKPGERLVYVCNQCKTVTERTTGTDVQPMDHCKEGAKVACPSCKESVRVVFKGMPKAPSAAREIVYSNGKGEECFFVAKIVSTP